MKSLMKCLIQGNRIAVAFLQLTKPHTNRTASHFEIFKCLPRPKKDLTLLSHTLSCLVSE